MAFIAFDRESSADFIKRYKDKTVNYDSVASKYIPFHAPFDSETYANQTSGKKMITYTKFNNGVMSGRKRFDSLYSYLETKDVPYEFTNRDVIYYAAKGILMDSNFVPLLVLCIPSDYFFSVTKDTMEKKKLVLIISSLFIDSDAHSSMYKRIYKEYVYQCRQEGIDVLITDKLVELCYSTSNLNIKFSSIAEMKAYLDNFNQLIYQR
jgi:hypothetical protein